MTSAPRIVLLSGIFPPDIGGPATHCHDLYQTLRSRGREVTVVTLHDGAAPSIADGVVRFPRRWPWPLRVIAVAGWMIANRGKYDVAYATGLSEAAALGARLARRPLVVKVVGDQAWERARRLGLTDDDFEHFQADGEVSGRARAMRWARDRALLAAASIVAPSDYLARLTEGWLLGRRSVTVVPNGVRCPVQRRARTPMAGVLRVAFVGRLVVHKQVDRIIAAVAATHGTQLDIVGDGPERASLEAQVARTGVGSRVCFLGERSHDDVLAVLGDVDALVLASDYEGLPHVVVEALAIGTPVVSPVVGGVTEVLHDGENGLVLPSSSASDVARALSRLRDDVGLRVGLMDGAQRTGDAFRFERIADRIESILQRATAPPAPAASITLGGEVRP